MFVCQELEAERQARSKSEKQRGTLARELDDLGERLDEAGKSLFVLNVVSNCASNALNHAYKRSNLLLRNTLNIRWCHIRTS